MKQNNSRWVFSDLEQDKWLSGPFAIINDVPWYMDNEPEVKAWLKDNVPGCRIAGTVIEFPRRDQLIMFRLRWA